MTKWPERIHQMVWGPWALVIFLGVGIYFTVKCHFFRVGGFLYWWSYTVGRILSGKASETGGQQGSDHAGKRHGEAEKGISQSQSVCMALTATAGTGNIAGVATALTTGGPGVLFWMWISALTGMITAHVETMLGIRYRYKDNEGRYVCGPFVYMERGFGIKGVRVFYSFLCFMRSLRTGSMVQANFVISTMEYTQQVPALAGGLVLIGILTLVICGGISRIGNMAEKLMPVASGIYIIFPLIVAFSCFDRILAALAPMVSSAFCSEAAAGGSVGHVVSRSTRYGIPRGMFSNEVSLGTLIMLHGPVESTTSHEQRTRAMFEVFFGTVILCTLIALVILCMTDPAPETVSYQGAALAAQCFSGRLGLVGEYLVSGSMMVFVFAIIMTWFYLGKQAVAYFVSRTGLGEHTGRKFAARVCPLLFLGAVFLGSEARLDVVWMLSDIWNGLMAFPNLTALLSLSREATLLEEFRGGLGRRTVGGKTTP